MPREFKLNENEIKAAEEFEQKHMKCAQKKPSTIGGHISYEFTPTAIGIGISVKWILCGEEKNITDYDLW